MTDRDKRRDPRVDTNQDIWVEGQDLRIQAEARNMSKGGMFVVAPPGEGQEIGQTLEIKFEDPQEGEIKLQMEVVWRDEKTTQNKLGLRALESNGKAAFERVVARYLDAAVLTTTRPDADDDEGDAK